MFVLTVPRADREIPSTSGDAIVAGPFVHPVAPDLAREGAGLPAAVVANPAALAGSPPRPRGREAVAARPVRPAEQSAPSGSWTVRLTVTGPKGAAVTWKGRMLGTVPIETEVPYEKDLVECRVTLPGHKTFRKSFVPVADLDVSATLPGIQAGGSDLMPLEP